jgi:lipid II isoglutaminyl synthase (glutamine-hydrolysing)
MKQKAVLSLAKIVRQALRLKGGHGSALPGYLIEKVDRSFLPKMLAQLPLGVVVVTGTNGKTTTTHMLVELLRQNELRVLTNESGSNLTRGLISTIVERSTIRGKLPYDIAIFELDEAYAPKFTRMVAPELLVALNVMRDQLDRYGELDTTATFIGKAAADAKKVVVNGGDKLLMSKVQGHKSLFTFGLIPTLRTQLSTEANLYAEKLPKKGQKERKLSAQITKISTTEEKQIFEAEINDVKFTCGLPLLGVHNAMNALVAVLSAKVLLPKKNEQYLADELRKFQPAFGRGESLKVMGRELTVALIKNPSGFTQNIATFVRPSISAILIVINDNYADGRDVSWLWDADIANLKKFRGPIFVGGVRRFDMALCLKYQGISCEVIDSDKSAEMMRSVMQSDKWHDHLLVIPTYTAMLAIRKWLATQQGVKRIW